MCIIAGYSYAQKVRVISKSDLQPVSNCLITNREQTISVLTDNQGIADLSAFKKTEIIEFNHISFEPLEIPFSAFSSELTEIQLTETVINLKEIVLSANKVEEKTSDLPVRVDIITSKQISLSNPQTTADILQQSGSVFIQQSQLGGGSAVIRGMETNRVLMVVDGVRMNNAIYRAGHIQNVITIDPNMLSRIEILHGPGSVIYGSDAMGGTMHFYTRNPILSQSDKTYTSGNIMMRYSSASNEYSQSFNLNIGGKKVAAFFGGSTKDIGDLRQGSKRDEKYGDWGKCLFYAERIDGKDVMTENSDPLVQKKSGYKQYDLFTKILYKASEYYSATINAQFSNSGNIPRYDRLTEMSGEKLKYAEWYYGPQTRGLISFKNEINANTSLFNLATFTGAYQYISEDRVSRSFGKSKKKNQEETVNVLSLNADFMKNIHEKSELRYGVEAVLNLVDSKAYNKNINTGEITYDAASRYPDGGNNMKNFAAYVSNSWEISDNLIFSQGIRFNYVTLEAKYTDKMLELIKFPFDAVIKQDNTAINGSLGIVYRTENGFRIAANASTGFRAPNIDDLTKLNDSNSSDQLIIVPNPELKPENAYNGEITVGKAFGNFLEIDVTGYYTLLSDAFVIRPSSYNNQDSILFDGTLSAVQSMQNVAKATIYGFESNLLVKFTKSLSLRSTLTYTYGHVKDEDVPLDHIPPIFGLSALKLDLNRFTAEFYARYNGWKKIDDFSNSGEDNEAYATEDGMPSWYTLNVKASFQLNKFVGIQAGIENILDKHYRNFASGISAPGRNVFVTFRGTL